MSRVPTESNPRDNRLLRDIPEPEFSHLSASLRPVEFEHGHVFYAAGERIDEFVFPTRGVISMLVSMSEGSSIEVGAIGREGATGVPALFLEPAPMEATTDVPGEGFALPVEAIMGDMGVHPALTGALLRYAGDLLAMVAQCAGCNSLHPLSARLARWLLMMHDRVGDNTFPLTHEVMSHMLGVQRSTVSVEAALMRSIGAITYRQGVVTVADRARLEEVACECYELIRRRVEGVRR